MNEILKQYQEYVDSQIEANLMPSTFAVWLEHENENKGIN